MENSGLGFYGENGISFQNDSRHLIENVQRILTTRRGERVGNLSFGSDVSRYIFMPDMTIGDLVQEVVNSIARCEPRVSVEECTIEKQDFDSVDINLKLRVLSDNSLIETSVTL